MGGGQLEDTVRQASANHSNIHLCPAVAPSAVLGFTANADVGVVGMENTCLNHYLSLPNKLFEYLTAGVPVIVPDFPEMRRVVDNYHQCGWSWSDDTEGLAALIRRLSPDEVKAKKQHALEAARDLSWEKEEQTLLRLYQTLLTQAHSYTGELA
jgi:glycosyltransferase involved in cell wall biosynthesis